MSAIDFESEAERYLWLRKRFFNTVDGCGHFQDLFGHYPHKETPEELDAAIDHAIQSERIRV